MARMTRSHPVAVAMRHGCSMKEAWRRYKGGRGRSRRRRNMPGRPWSGRIYRPSRKGIGYRPSLRRKRRHPQWVPTSFLTHVSHTRRKSRR